MKEETINIYEPRRDYYNDMCSLKICPECGEDLVSIGCTVILAVKSSSDQAEFMTNYHDSHFCKSCPVIVFDRSKLDYAASNGINLNDDEDCKYMVAGIVNMEAMEKKQELEMGSMDNPVILTKFLPSKIDIKGFLSSDYNQSYNKPIISPTIPGRNDPCSCGSGLKYKKCCGKNN